MDPATLAQTSQMMNTLNAEMRSLVQVIGKLTKDSSATAASMVDLDDVMGDYGGTVKELEDALGESRREMQYAAATQKTLTAGQQAAYQKANQLYQQAAQQAQTTAKLQQAAQQATGAKQQQLQQLAQSSATKQQLLTNQAGNAMRAFTGSTQGLTGMTNKLIGQYGTLATKIGVTAVAMVKLANTVQAASAGNMEGRNVFEGLGIAARQATFQYGISVEEFAKITTAQKQLTSAYGGSEKALKSLDDTNRTTFYTFRRITGDGAQALQAMLEASNNLARKGFKPTQQAMAAYSQDVDTLARRTGMSAGALNTMFEEVAGDIDSIYQLKAAREDEREAIVANQRAIIKNNIALGMSAEQAMQAAKMLNKMTAAKPLERLKQAAKMRALAGAMGVAGGEEAAQAVIAGPRASAEQRKQLMEFNKNLTNSLDRMRGQGLGAEIFATTLVDKLGLEEQYGPGSPFSTTLTEVLGGPLKETAQHGADTVAKLTALIDAVKNAFANPIQTVTAALGQEFKFLENLTGNDKLAAAITGLTAVLGTVAGLFIAQKGAGWALGKVGGVAQSVLGKSAGAVAGAASAAPAATSAMDMGKLANLTGEAGGTAAKGAAKGVGKALLKKLPVIGALAGLGFGAQRAMSGDWLGATGEVASGLASTIPGVGTAASVGIDAAMMARDVKKATEEQTEELKEGEEKKSEKEQEVVDEQKEKTDKQLALLAQIVELNKTQKEIQQKTLDAAFMTEKEKAEQRDLGERLTAMRSGTTAYKSIA